jgi:ABC-2 type transport system permease protein
MTALYKKEVRAFLSSVIGAVVLAVFLLVSGLFHWVFPGQWNLLDSGVAELTSFFLFTPWVFLFLIPAITMRSIAEERKNGTLELLLTHPLDSHRIVLAKFLAGTTLVAAALLPTLAGYLVLHQLSNPVGNIDGGSVLAGYFGLLLLGAAFVATGLATSARTDSQVVAFLSSALVCMVMYYGPSALGSYALFGDVDYIVQWFAMETHFRSIGTGVVVIADVAWFFAYIALALAFAQRYIQPGRA